jgi:hypothetical protein
MTDLARGKESFKVGQCFCGHFNKSKAMSLALRGLDQWVLYMPPRQCADHGLQYV